MIGYDRFKSADDMISDETNHRDEIRQILARWP